MKIYAKSPKKKIIAVIAALSATLTFGGALAYLTDHDVAKNSISFLKPNNDGLISLNEKNWENTPDGQKGKTYATNGILPGDTLTKDPTIVINNWLQTQETGDAATGENTNASPLDLFMRVLIPQASVTGSDPVELFEQNGISSSWTQLDAKAIVTVAADPTDGQIKADDNHPAGTYVVYRYYYGQGNTLTSVAPSMTSTPTTVAPLFTSVTYTKDATTAPSTNQHIIVDAYAIQADNLGTTDPAKVYDLASGESISTNA